MDWTEIIVKVIETLIVPLIGYGLLLLKRYLMVKADAIENEALNDMTRLVIEQANDAVAKAVAYIGQSFVDDIKGTYQWTAEAMAEAASKALTIAQNILSAEAFDLLDALTGSAADYLQAAIEEAVRDGKQP